MDYRNARNFRDDLTILYGHRMGGGRMFSDVTRFSEADYFNEHTGGILLTPDERLNLYIVAFAKIRADDTIVYDLEMKNRWAADYLYERAEQKRTMVDGGAFLLLSTCDAQEKSLRDVLLLRIQKNDMV